MALGAGMLTMSAAPVTIDFGTAEGLPTVDSETTVQTATISGVDFSFFHCKKGTNSGVSYLQLSGKNYDDAAYMTFTAPIAAKTITVHTGTNASTNVKVQLYAGTTAIGEPVTLDTKNKDFSFAIPEANQTAGTVFKIQTTNKYNAQLTTLTFSDEGGSVTPPTPPVEEWNPELGQESATFDVKTATDFKGTYIEEGSVAGDKSATRYQPLESLKLGGFGFAFSTTNTNEKSAPGFYYSTAASGSDACTIRLYSGTSMTVTAPADNTIRTIKLTGTNGQSMNQATVDFGQINPATTATSTTLEWAGDTDAVTFIFAGTYRITSVEVTYDNHSAIPASEVPTFSKEEGGFTEPFALTISAAAGAKIYYTLDGSQPTEDSDLYESPISITKTTTVKAVALEEGKRLSSVATATYTFEVAYNTLADLLEAGLADTNSEVKYAGKATVVYQNGKYLYLQDETAPILVYGAIDASYNAGDVITGFSGKMTTYKNLNELVPTATSFAAPVEKVEAPSAVKTDVEDVTPEDQNKYIWLEAVVLNSTTDENDKTTYTLVDEKDADIIAYPRFSDVTFPTDGKKYNVYGLVSVFGDDIQIYPTAFVEFVTGIDSIEASDAAATYFNLQGLPVAAPAQGQLLIKVQNGKATKVIF